MNDTSPIEQLFAELVQLDSSEERARFLESVQSDAPKLKSELQRLYAAHEEAGSFLGQSESLDETADFWGGESVGEQIGPYKLLQQLGEGGMGVVYLAERKTPVKQRVALKIIKHGMDSKKFIARFEAERQALAMMDHPNIAKVLDAGCTENGRPYFVMELVKGEPITKFCDENRLDTRERLELFRDVCLAVQHAHHKGIIHRDIKPSNVLVALYDQKPVPKVIDFGVAKATNQQLTEKTLFTEVGSILGTWEYMSPEQAVLNQLDVDTRTDVYSLGVLLYELLTGETPLDSKRLREAQLVETLRMIREEEPIKPSTRISGLGQRATSLAAYRNTNPNVLTSEVKGDLDWIALKALAKERTRRYDSTGRLAEDINNYLNNDLVSARPPSTLYRIRKFVDRNRVLVLSGGVVLASLAIAIGGITIGLLRANRLAVRLEQQNASLQATKNQVEMEKDRYARILDRLQDQFLQRAYSEALCGHRELVESEIENASRAGVPQSQLECVRSLADLFSGKHHKAIARAEEVVKDDPQSVVGWSLLVIANENVGDIVAKYDAMAPLKGIVPDGPYEQFFKTWALLGDGRRAPVDDLRSIVQQRPSWPIPRLILAESLALRAIDTGEIRHCLEAIENVEDAGAIVQDSPFALSIELKILTVAIKLQPSHEDCDRWESRASAIDSHLATSAPEYLFGVVARAWHQTCVGAIDDALHHWKKAVKMGAGNRAESVYAFLLIREGKYSEAAAVNLGAWALLLGERDVILKASRESNASDPWRHLWLQTARAICGERDEADAQLRAMLAEPRPYTWSIERPLLLLTGNKTPEEILAEIQDTGARDRSQALVCLAAYYLINNDSKKSRECYEMAVAENAFLNAPHYGAQVFLEKVQDESWLQRLRGSARPTD